ncbi:MAG TPA: DUF3368 domain-containing protein [Chloroflexi bacterium]|nr:DUF3368 domain-containing protein [Chloroflexota bacterium]
MNHPLVIANASPLIAFERLQRLDLLPQLLNVLHIPPAVRREVLGARAMPTWVVEQTLSQPISRQILSTRLGAGESEAIALALEVTPLCVLLDDLAARRLAQSFNLNVLGTVGLLLLARKRNVLPALRPSLDALMAADFRISEALYDFALAQVDE